MCGTALTRSVLAVGFVALAGAGCDLKTSLEEAQPHDGGTSSSDAGAAGASGGSAICVAEMGPTGVCKRCYDPSGMLVHEDCPPPPVTTPVTCSEGTDMNGRSCKTCLDASGVVVATDCNASVPGMMCVNIQDGGPTSCKDPGTWKQYGADACQQQNMLLTNVVGGTTCGAGYQDVTYVCCATVPSGGAGGDGGSSGGSGQMCTKIDEGDPTSCKAYDIWKQDAYDRCNQQNLLLTDIAVGPACDGGYQAITFTCCGGSVTPPPPPPPGAT